jgi:hypothetical protein
MSSRSADAIIRPFGREPITKAKKLDTKFGIGSKGSAFELPLRFVDLSSDH